MIAEDGKIEECFNWLKNKGVTPLTDKFFYAEENGKITAVAGLIICTGKTSCFARIEPMFSDSIKASYDLYNEIMDHLKKYKVRYVSATTGNEKLQKTLHKLGWVEYTKNFIEYFKEIEYE